MNARCGIRKLTGKTVLLFLWGALAVSFNANALTHDDIDDFLDSSFISTCQNNFGTPCSTCCALKGVFEVHSQVDGHIICDGSIIDNLRMSHIHVAQDFRISEPSQGCASCGAGACSSKSGDLPSLEITRIHRLRDMFRPSSFGPGVFCSYDVHLTLSRSNATTGSGSMIIFDPNAQYYRSASDPDNDGIYVDNSYLLFRHVKLYDAFGHVVVDQRNAKTAVLTKHDSTTYSFEIISMVSPDSSGFGDNTYGRLTRISDRNGNAIVVAYQFAANATDASMGYDRSNLWKINTVTDAYGRQAAFHYQMMPFAGAKWGSRQVVDRIDLPDGRQIGYEYGNFASGQLEIEGLSKVYHPNGDISTFVTRLDLSTQTQVISYRDPAAEGIHRNKDAYYTLSIWRNPVTNEEKSQSPFLLRMIINGEGEVSYFNHANAGEEAVYVYNGGNSMYRYTTVAGYPVKTEQLKTYTFADVFHNNQSAITYELIKAYGHNFQRQVTSSTDNNGKRTQYSREIATGAILRTTFPDGSFTATTYNQFKQPLTVTDRTGIVTKYAYDAHGNMLSKTVAEGTPAAATWRWEYNAHGQVVRAIDANGNATDYEYDSRGFLVRVIEPADHPGDPRAATIYDYDAAGRKVRSMDPEGRETEYRFDARNRCDTVIFQDGSREITIYGTGIDANLVRDKIDRNGNRSRWLYDAAGRDTMQITAVGTPVEVRDSKGYLQGTTLMRFIINKGNLSTAAYDYRNRQVRSVRYATLIDSLVSVTSYDRVSRIDVMTDPYGRKTINVYDDNTGYIIRQVTEAVPGAITSGMDLHTLTRDISANAGYRVVDYLYDAQMRLIRTTDGRGIVKLLLYDAQGRDTATIEALGTSVEAKTVYHYDPQGNKTRLFYPRTFSSGSDSVFSDSMTFTNRNLLFTKTVAAGTPDEATDSLFYNLDKTKSRYVDFRGVATKTFYYPCCGRIYAQTDSTGAALLADYDHYGNPTHTSIVASFAEQTNPRDPVNALNEFTTRFDARNRPVARTVWLAEQGYVNPANPPIAPDNSPEGLTTRLEYDDNVGDGLDFSLPYSVNLGLLHLGQNAAGSAKLSINPALEKSVQIYDGVGRLIMSIDAKGNSTRYTYDEPVSGGSCMDGMLVASAKVDPLGNTTRSMTDGLDRTIISEDAEGYKTCMSYDADGNRIGTRDPNGVGDDREYDARNRPVKITDTKGDFVQFSYDANGNQTVKTDAKGRISRQFFDFRNRIVTAIGRISDTTRYEYDRQGNLISITDADPLHGLTRYQYDVRNLLTVETFPDGGSKLYTYDAARRLTSRQDQKGQVTAYYYDMNNQLQSRHYPLPGDIDTFGYDRADRLVKAQSGHYANSIARGFDEAGRLIADSLSFGTQRFILGYGYDAASRMITITYPDGKEVRRTYTNRNQLDGVLYNGLEVAEHAYDPGMRLLMKTSGNGLVETRSYFNDNRIMRISVPGVLDLSYDYDANKNKTIEQNHLFPQQSQEFSSYDAENRLTGWSSGTQTQSWSLSKVNDWNVTTINGAVQNRIHNAVHEAIGVGASSLAYDFNGNLTHNSNGQTYFWDSENRLDSAIIDGKVARYAYDALGRRVMKTFNGKTVLYVYAGFQVVQEYETAQPQWQNLDIGSTGIPGSTVQTSGTFTVKGSGVDIWGANDAFQFNYKMLKGDGSITARVTFVQNTNSWAKAGVMIRMNLAPNAANAFMCLSAGNGTSFQRRLTASGTSVYTAGGSATAPRWVRLTRAGNVFTASQSVNGTSWTTVGSAVIAMGDSVYAGLAVTAHNNTVLNTSTFDNVAITGTLLAVNPAPAGLVGTLTGSDIGSVGIAGGTTGSNGSFTVSGSGADIWGTADAFRFAYQLLGSNTEIVARVKSVQNTNSWAKAGVMIRDDLAANAKNVFMCLSAGNGLSFQQRLTTGGTSAYTSGGAANSPRWVKIRRSGNTFTGYQSVDGVTWITVGSATVSMSDPVYVGLAVTAHNNAALCTAMFDNVGIDGQHAVPSGDSVVLARSYVYGGYVDEPLVMVRGDGEKNYYHANQHYSIMALTDSSGGVVERYIYDAFGKQTVLDSAGNARSTRMQSIGFTGRELDPETGLWYFRARMYSSDLGRFIGRDFLRKADGGSLVTKPKPGDGYQDGLNLYAGYFVPNGTDPTGLSCRGDCTILYLLCCAAWGETGIGFIACTAGYIACLNACPSYEFSGQAYCQVQITASNCRTATDLAVNTRWCVACPPDQPQNSDGRCPQGQNATWTMWDVAQGQQPVQNSPTCRITFVYQTKCCGDCPSELGTIFPQAPLPPVNPPGGRR